MRLGAVVTISCRPPCVFTGPDPQGSSTSPQRVRDFEQPQKQRGAISCICSEPPENGTRESEALSASSRIVTGPSFTEATSSGPEAPTEPPLPRPQAGDECPEHGRKAGGQQRRRTAGIPLRVGVRG